jgi:hypothetical protein
LLFLDDPQDVQSVGEGVAQRFPDDLRQLFQQCVR